MREEFREHCKCYKKGQLLVCEENHQELRLETKRASFWKIKIDGGVRKEGSSNKKCDFLIIEEEKEKIWIYVELKGEDLKKAYKQILDTFKLYEEKDKINYAAVVSSSSLKIPQEDTKNQNKENKSRKKLLKIAAFKTLKNKGFIMLRGRKVMKLEYSYENTENPIKKIN